MRTEFERRPLLVACVGLIIGLVLPTHLPSLAVFAVALFALSVWKSRVLLLGSVAVGWLLAPVPAQTITNREFLDGVITVASVPRIFPDRVSCIVHSGTTDLLATFPVNAAISMGDKLQVTGIEKPLSEVQEPIYSLRGVSAKLEPVRWNTLSGGPWVFAVAGLARSRFLDFTSQVLQADTSAMVDALCFNADSMLDRETGDALRKTGTVHIVSASGLHVLVLSTALMFVLSCLPVPRTAQLCALAGILLVYAAATGLNGPILRAVAMSLISSWAYVFKRERDLLSALALAAIAYLLWRPYEVFQAGFQLSFLTVGAFSLFLPAERRPLEWASASLLAWCATAPLVAFHFGYVPLLGIAANTVATFAVPAILVLAMAGFALSVVSGAVGSGLLLAVSPLVAVLYHAVTICAGLDFATVQVPSFSGYWLVPIYGAALLTWRRRVVLP